MNRFLPSDFLLSRLFHAGLPVLLACALVTTGHAGAGARTLPMPDFTKGDPIPEGATHDWNLGATGARGWMYSDKLETSDARQVRITQVAPKSPADGILQPGDVILGVAGKKFVQDPRPEIGKALTAAEASDGKLVLTCWRSGKEEDLTVTLPVLGSYSRTAPFACEKSKRILERGCAALALTLKQDDYNPDPIVRSVNALALLASGKKEYLPLVKREAGWAAGFSNKAFATWYYGYVAMFLGEYVIATGDQTVLPGLRRIALEAAKGQSKVGSWGHKFAAPDGRLYGYGMMNSPGIPLTIGLNMAKLAGVKDPEVARAIELSATLLRFYPGKGAIPYGDHAAWIQNHEDNGKCGMASVLFDVMREKDNCEFFARMSLASHGAERDTGHTGNFFNILWAMPAVARSGPNASGAWMKEFGSWYFDLARQHDGTFVHLGPPTPIGDVHRGWDATGVYLLAYAMPLRKLVITGKNPAIIPQLDVASAEKLIADGRGWSNKHRYEYYDSLDSKTLLNMLGSWSPIVRDRAGIALGRKKESVVPALGELLESPSGDARKGACVALQYQKEKAAAALPQLKVAFHSNDMWLRVLAAEAIAETGTAGMEMLPEMLNRIIDGPNKADPRGMEQRFLAFAVFDRMLKPSLDVAQQELLKKAMIAVLKNQDGRARGSVGALYSRFSYEKLKPLLPVIREAIVVPAPSGEMFCEGVQMDGLKVYSTYHIREGMQLITDFARVQKLHSSENRITPIMEMLLSYGAHAQAMIPQLEQLAAVLDGGEDSFPLELSKRKAKVIRDYIEKIKRSQNRPVLISST